MELKSLSADQILADVEIPLPALISKSLIFVVLGGVAVDLERKMYKN